MDFKDLTENEEEKEKRIKPKYFSKNGFVEWEPVRGIHQIKKILERIKDYPACVCGGYVRWMCSHNEEPIPAGDIDVYCEDETTFDYLRKHAFKDFEQKYENQISVGFKMQGEFAGMKPLQLIKPIKQGAIVAKGTMEEILDNFDFTIVRCGLTYKDGEVKALVDADYEYDESEKILRIKNIHCPISSTYRCFKYMQKGYWVQTSQVLKLFLDWENRDDEYRQKIIDFMNQSQTEGLTKTEIDQMEALMKID